MNRIAGVVLLCASVALGRYCIAADDYVEWRPDSGDLGAGVYALVIGCSYQEPEGGDRLEGEALSGATSVPRCPADEVTGEESLERQPLKQAVPAARDFAAHLVKVYKTDLRLALLLDTVQANSTKVEIPPLPIRPTLSKVSFYLSELVPRVPEGSQVIFYFAGHGDRPRKNCYTEQRSSLQLLLDGSRGTQVGGYAIRANEVVAQLGRTHRCIVMVVLDCCHSGVQEEIRDERGFKALRHRGLMIGATTSNDVSWSGRLTKALLDVWSETSVDCLTPTGLRNRIDEHYQTTFDSYLPRLWFGDDSMQCFADLREDSTLLIFLFPKGIVESGRIEFRYENGLVLRSIFDVSPQQEHGRTAAIGRTVPDRGKLKVSFYSTGSELISSHEFAADDLSSRGTILTPVIPSDERFRGVADAAKASVREAIRLASDFGVPRETVLVDSARVAYTIGSSELASNILLAGAAEVRGSSSAHRWSIAAPGWLDPFLVHSEPPPDHVAHLMFDPGTVEPPNATWRLGRRVLDELTLSLVSEYPDAGKLRAALHLPYDQLTELVETVSISRRWDNAARIAELAAKTRVDLSKERVELLVLAAENYYLGRDLDGLERVTALAEVVEGTPDVDEEFQSPVWAGVLEGLRQDGFFHDAADGFAVIAFGGEAACGGQEDDADDADDTDDTDADQ